MSIRPLRGDTFTELSTPQAAAAPPVPSTPKSERRTTPKSRDRSEQVTSAEKRKRSDTVGKADKGERGKKPKGGDVEGTWSRSTMITTELTCGTAPQTFHDPHLISSTAMTPRLQRDPRGPDRHETPGKSRSEKETMKDVT